MRDVALDLAPLGLRQAALADREHLDLFRAQEGPVRPLSTGKFSWSSKLGKLRARRLITARKLSSSTTVGSFAFSTACSTRSASALRRRYSASISTSASPRAAGLVRLEARAQVVGLDRLQDVGEALPDRDHLAGVELLALAQVLLLHRHLAEVVEQRGVAQLLDLVGA